MLYVLKLNSLKSSVFSKKTLEWNDCNRHSSYESQTKCVACSLIYYTYSVDCSVTAGLYFSSSMSKFHWLHWDQTLTLDGSGLPWIMLKVWLELWVQWTEGLGESYKLCYNQNNKLIISAHHDVFDWKNGSTESSLHHHSVRFQIRVCRALKSDFWCDSSVSAAFTTCSGYLWGHCQVFWGQELLK